MLAYRRFHPFEKQAQWRGHLLEFASENARALKAKLKAMKTPQFWKDTAKAFAPEMAGIGAGVTGGGIYGNMAYKNAIPSVRALPRLDPDTQILSNEAFRIRSLSGQNNSQ